MTVWTPHAGGQMGAAAQAAAEQIRAEMSAYIATKED